MGRSMGALLSSTLDKAREDKNVEEKEFSTEEELTGVERIQQSVENNKKLEEILEKHTETLEALGLSVDSPNKLGDFDGNETYAVGEMGIDVADKEKFIGYLRSLQGNEEVDMQFVRGVFKKVLKRIGAEYSFESADDRLLEVLSGARDMAQEAKRLGLSGEAIELERCAQYSKQGALPDYVEARKKGIFTPITGETFDFSTYQRDATYDDYVEYWQPAFAVLDRVKAHPKSAQLYQDIRAYLSECIAFAEKDPSMNRLEAGYVEGVRRAIADTKKKLETYN